MARYQVYDSVNGYFRISDLSYGIRTKELYDASGYSYNESIATVDIELLNVQSAQKISYSFDREGKREKKFVDFCKKFPIVSGVGDLYGCEFKGSLSYYRYWNEYLHRWCDDCSLKAYRYTGSITSTEEKKRKTREMEDNDPSDPLWQIAHCKKMPVRKFKPLKLDYSHSIIDED